MSITLTTILETDCQVCFLGFNSTENRPLVLKCGHTFCSSCLTQLYRQQKISCPFCKAPSIYISLNEIPANFTVLEAVDQSNDIAKQISCQKHKGFKLESYCTDCKDLTCTMCVKENHQDHSIKSYNEVKPKIFESLENLSKRNNSLSLD